MPRLIQAQLFADPLADLGRDVRVCRELREGVTGRERKDRVHHEADDEQRRDGDEDAPRYVSPHSARIPVSRARGSGGPGYSVTIVAPSPPSDGPAGSCARTSGWVLSAARIAVRSAPVPFPWMMRRRPTPATAASFR